MIRGTFLLALTLSTATLFAQTTTPQAPPPGAPAQTGAGAAPSQVPPRRQKMQQMQEQHMQKMQQQLQQFRTLLDKMKADAAKLQDPAGKQVAQDNIDLWQALYDHMEGMQQMMQQHGGMMMGPGGMRPGPRRMGPPPAQQPKTTPPPQS